MKKRSLPLVLFTGAALFMILASPTVQACTFTPGFWKNHPKRMVSPINRLPITIGSLTLNTPAQVVAILKIEPEGDATYILAHHLIALKLTTADWTIIDSITQGIINEADALLTAYPLGSDPSGAVRDRMIELSELLADINESDVYD